LTGKRVVIRYATKERKEKVNPKNISAYEKYLKSRISRNKDVKNSTYRQYQSATYIWYCFLMEEYDNPYILDEEFLTNDFIDMMDDYVFFLQDELKNGKKKINFNLSAISSFYIWAVSRKMIPFNPMNNIQRMENANDEKIIESVFLTQEQVNDIHAELVKTMDKDYTGRYDLQDLVLFGVMYFSASRISAIHSLSISDLIVKEEENIAYFDNIREKRGKITKVVVDMKILGYINKYIEDRKEKGIDTDALFVSKVDGEWGRMSKQGLYNRAKKIGLIVGEENMRPHNYRKTRGNLLYKEYGIEVAQQVLLHESSDTTKKHYIEQTGVDDVFAKILNKSE